MRQVDRAETDRRRAQRFGVRAEVLCAILLRLGGYRIIARGFRVPVGEIDIVAQKGRVLAFVEIKARRGKATNEVLTRRQRRRIERAAEAFLAVRPDLATRDVRFDLIQVGGWKSPHHLRAAWRPGE